MADKPVDRIYGISITEWEAVRQILSRFTHVQEAVLFGSRAKGTYKPGSDIDLAVKGADINKDDISSLLADFEASLLPYFVDIIHYSAIKNEALKEHIDRVGICIYQHDIMTHSDK